MYEYITVPKMGAVEKNVQVQSVHNWRGLESVPVQFRKWEQESDKHGRRMESVLVQLQKREQLEKCTGTVHKKLAQN